MSQIQNWSRNGGVVRKKVSILPFISTTTIPTLQDTSQDGIKGQKEAKPAGFELFHFVSRLS